MTETARAPLWLSIATELKGEIVSGAYGPGDRLPTEAALAARFGVNRHTVRHALAALAEEGIVASRRGSGTRVTARPTEYRIGARVRFHQNLRAEGRVPGRRLASVGTRGATAEEAEALDLGPGAQVHVADGVSLADGVPIALFRSLFPAEILPDLPARLGETNSVTAALASCGVADYLRDWTRITAVAATATQAATLQVAAGAALVLTTGLNVGQDGRPVEFGRTWFAGERVTLTLARDDL